jgi:hypothetical protein
MMETETGDPLKQVSVQLNDLYARSNDDLELYQIIADTTTHQGSLPLLHTCLSSTSSALDSGVHAAAANHFLIDLLRYARNADFEGLVRHPC